jgi:alpha-beta hydrolase superfamily lysophospholipase
MLGGSGTALRRVAGSAPAGTNILNARFESARTPVDWLTRDTAIVDAFLKDPLCFPQLQPASFESFLAAGARLSDLANLRKIRDDLPVYIFSGGEDPVGERLQGVRVLIDRYRKAGLHEISLDFYPGGRHKMLNEINRDEVMANLLCWISAVLTGRRTPLLASSTIQS